MLLGIFLFVSCATSQDIPPNCPLFTTVDPATGNKYTYDLSQLTVPDPNTSLFIAGTVAGATWTAYLNICGNAKAVGCTSDSPICQDDSKASGKYYTFGTSASWTMSNYYDPTVGPTSSIPGGGVSVWMGNGESCGNGVQRQAYLFFKCDPTVTERPATVVVNERDPVTGNDTPCKYFFAPIRHASFCPIGNVAPASVGAEFSITPTVQQSLGQMIVSTTSPVPFLQAGLTCGKGSGCTAEVLVFVCTGNGVALGEVGKTNVTSLAFHNGASSWTFGSAPVGSSSGNCSEPGPFVTSSGQGSWAVSGSTFTAYSGGEPVVTLKGASVVSCNSCKQRFHRRHD